MIADLQPAGERVFAAAVNWLQGTLLGSLATTVAVIAIASVGLLLFSGRIDIRRGAQMILGCFILFGAASIAAGIMRVADLGNSGAELRAPQPPLPVYALPAAPKSPVKAAPYDPYAGASLPPNP